jgi:hypothetical protein
MARLEFKVVGDHAARGAGEEVRRVQLGAKDVECVREQRAVVERAKDHEEVGANEGARAELGGKLACGLAAVRTLGSR